MKFSRRDFLGSTGILLGSRLLEMLTTPLWKWRESAALEAATVPGPENSGSVTFVDVARQAGLTIPNVWGGIEKKRYILEAKGNGLAFFDFDNDGWLDIYLTNGVRFEETYTPGNAPISHLYKNNRDGTFTDVTERAGVGRTGWGTGVCVGDYDNDGWDDLFCISGAQHPLAQQRGWHVYRRDQEGRPVRRAGALGERLHLAGL
jgi:hypothetical protein